MQTKSFAIAVIPIFAVLVVAPGLAYARGGAELISISPAAGVGRLPLLQLAEKAIDQDQAAEIAQKSTGAKVLGVRTGQGGSENKVYEVKMLSGDGRVIVVRVDGQTGAILH